MLQPPPDRRVLRVTRWRPAMPPGDWREAMNRPITPEQVLAGDPAVREKMFAFASRHARRRLVPLADSYQDAWEAALEAAARYDPDLGHEFNRFAMAWVSRTLKGRVHRYRRFPAMPEHLAAPDPTPFDADPGASVDRALSFVASLPAQQRRIVEMLFPVDGSPAPTQSEVARRIGCTRAWVSRTMALARYRAAI